jgi:predicted dehydrogenase
MPLKFAYLGAWHSHAPMHVREAARRPDEFQLVGMYDPDPGVVARNQQRWAEYHLPLHVFPSAAAVLESTAEAVIVEGHIYQNLDYAEQALEAGKHVLLEKPAGVDLAQLERIHHLAKKKGLMLQMAYMWRYNPAIHEIIRLARVGALGQIFQYRGHIPKPKEWHPQLAEEFSAYHGGVYFEMAGHLVDLMVGLLGDPLQVHPVLGQHYGDRAEVDNAVVVHEFESGLGVIDTTGMQVGMARRLEVHGTGGTALHAPLASSNLSLFLEKPVDHYKEGWQEIEIDEPPEFPSLLRELAACVNGTKEPDYTLEHDLNVQRTLLQGCGITDGKALKNPM